MFGIQSVTLDMLGTAVAVIIIIAYLSFQAGRSGAGGQFGYIFLATLLFVGLLYHTFEGSREPIVRTYRLNLTTEVLGALLAYLLLEIRKPALTVAIGILFVLLPLVVQVSSGAFLDFVLNLDTELLGALILFTLVTGQEQGFDRFREERFRAAADKR